MSRSDGGIANSGFMTIVDSTISDNVFAFSRGRGGGIFNIGTFHIVNTTIARNGCFVTGCEGGEVEGGGIYNTGMVSLANSTIAENQVTSGGGIANFGTAELQNTIVASNNGNIGPDCTGAVTSSGHNLIGDTTGCAVTLQPNDLTGDPGLSGFTDVSFEDDAGFGRFPLLETSQAIDHGNNEVCSSDPSLATDQLGKPRSVAGTVDGPRICDIGAVEFFPVVNDLVQLKEVATQFDATPVQGGAAGTFLITATFQNISNQTIFYPFFEVAAIHRIPRPGASDPQPLLLNGDPGLRRVGARLTPADSLTTPFQPGTNRTVQFLIGLPTREPFTFFVNMLGEARSSNALANLPH